MSALLPRDLRLADGIVTDRSDLPADCTYSVIHGLDGAVRWVYWLTVAV